MIKASNTQYWRLSLFKSFWCIELKKDKIERIKPLRFQDSVFTKHVRNMREMSLKMAKQKGQKKPKFDWKGYVNVGITEALVPDLEKFVADEKAVFEQYNLMLVTNYQIKLYYDDYSESLKCVAVCHQHDDPNFGLALTSFAEDWYTALAVMIFKHTEICDKDWSSAKSVTVKKFG